MGLSDNYGISVLQVARLCDYRRGAEYGPFCVFHTPEDMLKMATDVGMERGYVAIASNMQDYANYNSTLNINKKDHYIRIINTLKDSGRFFFVTPEELYQWKRAHSSN